ncbi:unnamed protein product, partial [Symbiodinium sp. KB8]
AKKLFESVPPPVGASGLEVLLCRIAVAVFPGKGDPGASVSPLRRCLPSEAVLGVRYAQTRQLRTARHSPSAAYDIMAPIDGVGVGHAAGMPRPRALLDASSPATEGRAPRPHSRTDRTASRRKGPLISAAGIANSAAVPDEKQSHDVDDVRSRGNRASSGPAAAMEAAGAVAMVASARLADTVRRSRADKLLVRAVWAWRCAAESLRSQRQLQAKGASEAAWRSKAEASEAAIAEEVRRRRLAEEQCLAATAREKHLRDSVRDAEADASTDSRALASRQQRAEARIRELEAQADRSRDAWLREKHALEQRVVASRGDAVEASSKARALEDLWKARFRDQLEDWASERSELEAKLASSQRGLRSAQARADAAMKEADHQRSRCTKLSADARHSSQEAVASEQGRI